MMTKRTAVFILTSWLLFVVGVAHGQELLTNGGLELPPGGGANSVPAGWTLVEEPSTPPLGPQNTAELIGFAAHSGQQGLWLREFEGLFFGNNNEGPMPR
jgi:hypothetical protein